MTPQEATSPWWSVRCAACAGSLTLSAIAPQTTCPYCRHTQTLPPATVAQLTKHRDGVARRLRQAQAQLDRAVAVLAERATAYRAGDYLLTLAMPLGALVLLIGVVVALRLSADIGPSLVVTASVGFMLCLCWVPVAATWLRKIARKRHARRLQMPDDTFMCSCCGGDNTLPFGETLWTCAYCRVALAPTPTVSAKALEAARRAVREARGAVAYQLRRYLAMSFYRVGGPGANATGWHHGMMTFAKQRGGSLLADLAAVERWLDCFWAGPDLGAGDLLSGATDPFGLAGAGMESGSRNSVGLLAVALVVADYPILVDSHSAPRLQLLLATDEPELGSVDSEQSHPALLQTQQTLLSRGYTLEVSEAGLRVQAAAALGCLAYGGQALGELGWVLDGTVDLARQLRRKPATAMQSSIASARP